MPSLRKRVSHQRDTLLARGPGIRLHGERVHARLRHPAVLIPAFLAGTATGRGAPVLVRALPRLTARLQHLTGELHRLHTAINLIASLVTVGPSTSDAAPGELGAQPHRPNRTDVLS